MAEKDRKRLAKEEIDNYTELNSQARMLTDTLNEIQGIRTRLTAQQKVEVGFARDLQKSAFELNSDLRKRGQLETRLLKDRTLYKKLEAELSKSAEGQTELNKRGQEILSEINKLEKKRGAQAKERVSSLYAELDGLLDGLTQEEHKNLVLSQNLNVLREIIETREKEKSFQKEINKNLGITGALLDNLNKVGLRAFGGLGINLGALEVGISQAKEAADEEAESLAAGTEGIEGQVSGIRTLGNRLRVMKKALPGIKKAFTSTLFDPLVLGKLMLDSFGKLSTLTSESLRLTGQRGTEGMVSMTAGAAHALDQIELIQELTKQIGFNAQNAFSRGVLESAANLKVEMGLSAESAGNLALVAQATGESLKTSVDDIVDITSNYNKQNKSAVSQGIVLRDISNVSEGIRISFGGSLEALTKAASSARRLGIELSELDGIAKSLLDFESSIQNELEAELLTNKSLNLERAREYALTNELDKLGQELFRNSASILEYGKMNRVQQEAYAQALGMSRDQLARTAYLRGIELHMTEKQAAAAAQVSAEDMRALSAQEGLKRALEKITLAFTPILETVAVLASKSWMMYTAMAAIAGISMVKLIGQVTALAIQSGLFATSAVAAKVALTGVLGAAAIAAAIAGVYSLINSQKRQTASVRDAVIDPKKGPVVTGDFGSVQLDSRDQIVAGTNLGGGSNTEMREMRRVLDRLVAVVEKGGDVYLDGNRVGQALVLGSYKSS